MLMHNYHIDANNSGAWKRVLRDVAHRDLNTTIVAVESLLRVCPGTAWRIVDARTEVVIERGEVNAATGGIEWRVLREREAVAES